MSEEEKIKQVVDALLNPDYKIRRDIIDRGIPLAVAVYGNDGRLVAGVRKTTWESNAPLRIAVEKALEQRKENIHRASLEKCWQVQALLGNFDYLLRSKLLPPDVFHKLGSNITYMTREMLDDFDEFDRAPGWDLTEKGKKMLVEMAEKTISEEQRKVLAELLDKKHKAEEEEMKMKRNVREAVELLLRIDAAGEKAEYIPEKDYTPQGEQIDDPRSPPDIYGAGNWWVIEKNRILYITNNGMDGDDWSLNNIRDGGAGAIGRAIPYNEEIANALRRVKELTAGMDENVFRHLSRE